MGIRISDETLEIVLDAGFAVVRSGEAVPELWVQRVERLSTLGVKTYIAALGAALLARAADDRVDSLTQDEGAGSHGYSLRSVAEFLATHNDGRFHMGATGRWPLNNRPFLGGPSRIDEFTKISTKARPAFELFRDCLFDLNRMSAADAGPAFAAWLRVRMQVMRLEEEERAHHFALRTAMPAAQFLRVCDVFLREHPEGGRAGQAFVAAVLTCAHEEVSLQPVNSPAPGDVRVFANGTLRVLVEVKQLPTREDVVLAAARDAVALGCDAALVVILSPRHAAIDKDRVQHNALNSYGVALLVCESVWEFAVAVCVCTATPLHELIARLPSEYAQRLRQHEASARARDYWSDVTSGRAVP